MTSLFKGIAQAQNYAIHRPQYPAALYEHIVSKMSCSSRSLCVDVGCGNGQATVALADYFDSVLGIDPSPSQLENAKHHPNVTYQLGTMMEHLSKLEDESVSCVTCAQASHWLDIPDFYMQVQRVLKPGGVLAMWTYYLNKFPNNEDAEVKLNHFFDNVLDGYWDDRRKLVDNKYRDIPLIDELYPDLFSNGERIYDGLDIKQYLSADQFAGYLRSWSAYRSFSKEKGIVERSPDDPVLPICKALGEEESPVLSIMPVTMLISTKRETPSVVCEGESTVPKDN